MKIVELHLWGLAEHETPQPFLLFGEGANLRFLWQTSEIGGVPGGRSLDVMLSELERILGGDYFKLLANEYMSHRFNKSRSSLLLL